MTSSWPNTPMGNFLEERTERPSIDSIILGEVPIIAKIGFNTGRIELRSDSKTKTNMISIYPGDLVLSGINAEKGAIAIYGKENENPAAATIHYSSYLVNSERADILYLWYFMRSNTFRSILIYSLPGGIKTEVKPKRLLPIEISLPSLVEQKRIVSKIESLVARVEEAQKLNAGFIEELEKALDSKIRAIFSNSLFKQVRLGSIINDIRYGTSDKCYPDIPGVPVLRMGNIQDGKIIYSNLVYLNLPEEFLEKYKLKKGDILINRTNSAELVGKSAVFDGDVTYIYASYIIRVRVDSSKAVPNLIVRYINSSLGREYMLKEKKQMTGQANVNSQKIKSIMIPLPPLPEQRRIVAYLDSLQVKVDELKRLQTETQMGLAELTPSILDRAFKGEL